MRIGDKVKATIPGHTAGIVTVTVTIQHSGLHRMVAITVAVLTLGTPTAVAAAEHPSQGRSTTATGQIQATAEHPIHVTTPTGDGHWVNAADLHPGQQLTSSDPTHTITVTRVDSYTKGLTAYNLTTTPQHTYYINPDRAPPATNVLVHNAAACPLVPKGACTHCAMRWATSCGLAARRTWRLAKPRMRGIRSCATTSSMRSTGQTCTPNSEVWNRISMTCTRAPRRANGGLNKIRAISPWNPRRGSYMQAAQDFLERMGSN